MGLGFDLTSSRHTRFEYVAWEDFVFGKGLAEVEARAADEEAVQGVAGAVSLGNEFAVHPVLLPVFAQFA